MVTIVTDVLYMEGAKTWTIQGTHIAPLLWEATRGSFPGAKMEAANTIEGVHVDRLESLKQTNKQD